jgi:Arc/MetJ-type ribon-helix-helix transcriptional regulator
VSDQATKENRHTVRISRLQTTQLHDLRVRKGLSSMSDVIRYCIEYTLEDESDAIGSRRHFSRTMSQKIDELAHELRITSAINLLAITDSITNLINMLEEDEETEGLKPDAVRIELYQAAVSPELFKIVNALDAI